MNIFRKRPLINNSQSRQRRIIAGHRLMREQQCPLSPSEEEQEPGFLILKDTILYVQYRTTTVLRVR